MVMLSNCLLCFPFVSCGVPSHGDKQSRCGMLFGHQTFSMEGKVSGIEMLGVDCINLTFHCH